MIADQHATNPGLQTMLMWQIKGSATDWIWAGGMRQDWVLGILLVVVVVVVVASCICANNNKTDLTGPTPIVTISNISSGLWIVFNYIMFHANWCSSLSIFPDICLCQKLCFFPWGGGDWDIIVSLKFKRLKIWIKLEVDLVIKLGIIWQALEAYYHNGDVF